MPEDEGHSIQDVNCAQCGYLLRGRTASDNCPECGLPGDESFRPDLLQYSDPKWLRRLAAGCRITVVGLGGMVVIVAAFRVAFMIGTWSVFSVPVTIALLVYLAMEVIVLIGIWRLSHAEPRSLKVGGACRIRVWARRLLVGGLAVDIVYLGLESSLYLGWGVPNIWWAMDILPLSGQEISILSDLLLIGGLLLGLLYLARLAARLPNMRYCRSLAITKWGLVICIALGLVAQVLFWVMAAFNPGTNSAGWTVLWSSYGLASLATTAVTLGFATWLTVTLMRFRRQLRVVSDRAETSRG